MDLFYNKIHNFIFTDGYKDDTNQHLSDLSTNEANAILHYIITLSEIIRSTYHRPIGLEKKAIFLIDRYNASISSEYGFSQNCQIYSKQYPGCENIIYDAKIDPGICVQKFDQYHMIKDGTMCWPYQYISDRILTYSLIHDPLVKTNRECLNMILKLNMVNNDHYKGLIEQLIQNKDTLNDTHEHSDNLKRKNDNDENPLLDPLNKKPKNND
jgi:hypothetical protein